MKKPLYFIGRRYQIINGLRKYQFFSRHKWPFYCASVLVESETEMRKHFAEFVKGCRDYERHSN